jgi:kynurenine formamidase
VLTAGGPTYPGDPPVEIHRAATIERDGYHLQSLVAGEQAGTHWAAPAHFAAGQAAADELDPGDFFYPAVVLDVRAEVKENPDLSSASPRSRAGRRNSGRFRRTAPSSCGRASRTAGTTRRPT